jgi:hypothetical protein
MEMFLELAAELGFTSDEEIARLAHVSADNVANWRSGAVREFKVQRLRAAIDSLRFHIRALRAQAGLCAAGGPVIPLSVEDGSSPADLQRQFRERVGYDYLGHRFLYFEPHGALSRGRTSSGQATSRTAGSPALLRPRVRGSRWEARSARSQHAVLISSA